MTFFKKILLFSMLLSLLSSTANFANAATNAAAPVMSAGKETGTAIIGTKAATAAMAAGTKAGLTAVGPAGGLCHYVAALFGTGFIPTPPGGICLQVTALGGITGSIAGASSLMAAGAVSAETSRKLTWIEQLQKFAWDMSRLLLKNLILDRLVDEIIGWIDNDGQGAIISDWGAFFEEAGQYAVGGVAKELGMGFLCSNFDLNLRIALAPSPKFSQRMTCSLNDIVGNIDSFMENFTNGNWIGYQELWQPKNNFYGGVIMGLEEIALQKAAAKDAAQSEAIAGNGFLSFKNCDKNGNCTTVVPGQLVGSAAALATQYIPANRIINSSDFDMYFTAIADAGIKKLLKMGISGLKGLNLTKTADQASKDPCSGLTGQTYVACIGAQKAQNSYFASKKDILAGYSADALSGRQALQDVLVQSIAVQDDLVSKLNRLAQCGKTDTAAELITEQETLNYLQSKYNDNQVFIDQIMEANAKVDSTAENDWTGLANSADTQFIGDEYSSLNETNFAKDELERLQANADKKLPAIENALTSCPAITTPTH